MRYQLLDAIGSGGMGVVYRAEDRLTHHIIALKRVHLQETSDLDLRVSLTQEFRTLASLRHAHIVSVLDYGFDADGHPFFTMEYLQNAQTLRDYALDQSLDEKLRLLSQLMQAIHYLHRRGIIHRDLKPDNVLVVDGQVKLLDFGLAIAQDALRTGDQNPVGTLAYIAPEQLIGERVGEAADLYSVGVIAYEILSGKHPLLGESVTETINNILRVIPSMESLDVPEWVKAILVRLLEKDPTERFESSLAVIAEINANIAQPIVSTLDSYLKAATFVGRERELGQLKQALTNLVQEQVGSAWLIGGESGVGKTRLMDELRVYALVEGALVLRGEFVTESVSPYQAWQGVLRHLALDTALTLHETAVLKRIIPDLPGDVAPIRDSRNAQIYVINTIEGVLARQARPVVILLEDLQWVGEDIAILKQLTANIGQLPVMIVANYRDDERPHLPNELPDMARMKLSRFNADEVEALSQSIIGADHPQVVGLLTQETEGNVFFIVEVLRALAEEAGGLEKIGYKTLPTTVFAQGISAIVQRRLTHIPADDYPLLQLAAVAGRQLDLDLLKRLSGQDDLSDWLSHCADAAVLEVREDRWLFAHDKLREGVLAALPDRADLHQRIAEALESLYADDRAANLAYHWAQAGNRAKEAHFSVLAGEDALQDGSYHEAQTYLLRALELGEQGALRPYGEVLYGLGDYAQAKDRLQASLAQGGNTARTLNVLGNIELARGENLTALDLLTQARQVAVDYGDTLEVARALRSMGVVAETLTRRDDATRYFQEALALFHRVHDLMGLAATYTNLANLARHHADYDKAEAHYQAGLRQFEALNFAWGTAFTLTSLGTMLHAQGKYADAKSVHERAVSLCRKVGHQWGLAYCLGNYAQSVRALGEQAETGKALQEAFRVAWHIQTLPLVLDLLTTYAATFETIAPDYAQELYALVMHHDLTEPETREKLRARFGDSLPASPLTLEGVLSAVLDEDEVESTDDD